MNKYNDEKIAKEIKEGLDFIDQKIPVNTPDMARFRKMVADGEYNKQKKAKKETIIFVLTAVMALVIETYTFNQSILFFFIIQGFAFTSFLIWVLNWFIRGHKKVKSI
jgi:hypothetical protein